MGSSIRLDLKPCLAFFDDLGTELLRNLSPTIPGSGGVEEVYVRGTCGAGVQLCHIQLVSVVAVAGVLAATSPRTNTAVTAVAMVRFMIPPDLSGST